MTWDAQAGFRISTPTVPGAQAGDTRRGGGAPCTEGTSSPRIPGDSKSQKRAQEISPNPSSADHGRHQVGTPGCNAAAAPRYHSPGRARAFHGTAATEACACAPTRLPRKALSRPWVGWLAPPARSPPWSSPSVGMVQPGSEAPGVGSVAAPSLPGNVGLWSPRGGRDPGGEACWVRAAVEAVAAAGGGRSRVVPAARARRPLGPRRGRERR